MNYELSFDRKTATLLALCITAAVLLLLAAGFLLGAQYGSTATPLSTRSAKDQNTAVVAPLQSVTAQPAVAVAPAPTAPNVEPAASVRSLSSTRTGTPETPLTSSERPVSKVVPVAGYSLQFGAFREEANAEAVIKHLKAKNVEAKVFPLKDMAGTTWYTVRSGNYSTLSEASAAAMPLRKSAQQSILIRPANTI